ncbi:MAG: substrate-binding domain-containing protein [Bacteroidetes bacterium]|nr:substrate-binding domain-containing protein [Bacteroidota bacterium]
MSEKSRVFTFIAGGLLVFLMMLTGCNGNVKKKATDTPTSGTVKIGVDDSYKLLADAEIFTFQSFYSEAKIDTICRPETDILNAFLKDSVSMMIVNRPLTKEEEQNLNAKQIIPRTLKIAYDAVALIVNNENPDSNLFYDHIASIFQGKIDNWKQINPKSKLNELKIVFDNFKSGIPRYFREKFLVSKLPANCFAVHNNEEVIDFVEKNKNAIGMISVNWVSDRSDTVTIRFLKKVKIAGISTPGTADPHTDFYQPYQAYIAKKIYPFIREVYCINRQTYVGLAYGLTSFIAGSQGQLIVLHSGLVPATMPVRVVEIKH